LHALFQTLKSGDTEEILELINLIRSEALPGDIAGCLRKNIQSLQDRDILPTHNIDETDLVSLGLQGLFSHRAGRPGLKQTSSKSSNQLKVTLKGLEELRSPTNKINEPALSTPSLSFSHHGSHMDGHGGWLAFTNELNLVHRPIPLDSMSLLGDDMGHSSSGLSLSFATSSPCSPNQNSAKSEINPGYGMSYRPHSLTNPSHSSQSFSKYCDTGPNSVHAEYLSSQLALPDHQIFVGCRDEQPDTSANACALEQLNDFQRAEYELGISHKMPYDQWNIPTCAYEASARPQNV